VTYDLELNSLAIQLNGADFLQREWCGNRFGIKKNCELFSDFGCIRRKQA
jgi:hypothetical protein